MGEIPHYWTDREIDSEVRKAVRALMVTKKAIGDGDKEKRATVVTVAEVITSLESVMRLSNALPITAAIRRVAIFEEEGRGIVDLKPDELEGLRERKLKAKSPKTASHT